MKWVTRERPKIDRIACPWLIERFIDKAPEFLFVPAQDVLHAAAQTGAIPYDIPGVELSHVGELCSFDAFLSKYRLTDAPLAILAVIVRGADPSRLNLAPEAAGLFAISLGLSKIFKDDHEMLKHGMVIYDALYAWCDSCQNERHGWPPQASLSKVKVTTRRMQSRYSLKLAPAGRQFFISFAFVFLSMVPTASRGQGGPPLLTDDPATPGNGNWEINIAYAMEKTRGEKTADLPRVDINYGLGSTIQLKYEVARTTLDRDSAGARSGLSNSLVGVKWRFLEKKQAGFDMSVYPQVEFNNPTGSLDRGLVDKSPNLLLPIEASKMFGDATIVGEVGRWYMRDAPDEWLVGVAISVPWSESLELLAELHTTTDKSFGHADPVLNFGARKALSESFSLLASAGTGLSSSEDRTEVVVYFGLQFHPQ